MFTGIIISGYKMILGMIRINRKTRIKLFRNKDLHSLALEKNDKELQSDIQMYFRFKEIGQLSLVIGLTLLLVISLVNVFFVR